jgi:hypothetical protein
MINLRRIVRATLRGALLPARYAAVLMMRWRAPKIAVEGVAVSLWDRNAMDPLVLGKLRDAIKLIRRSESEGRAAVSHLHRITIERLEVAGLFQPWAGGVFLDIEHLRDAPAVEIACTLVHEATHAQLHGLRPHSLESAEQIERSCVAAELGFLESLGAGHEDLYSAVAQKPESHYWTPQARFERRMASLRDAGLPRWYLRAYSALLRP